MKVTAWNKLNSNVELGRIVASSHHDVTDVHKALNVADTLARTWNRTEKRPDMRVNFISCNGYVRAIG